MSIGEAGYSGGSRGARADDGAELLRLISQAVFGALIEDWTVESVEFYRAFEGIVAARQLPDDTIEPGSATELRLVQWLGGEQHPLERLDAGVRDFLALVVSGSSALEEETAFCRVVWVKRAEVAEPVFSLPAEHVE